MPAPKKPHRPNLSVGDRNRIKTALIKAPGVTCSSPWCESVLSDIEAGKLGAKPPLRVAPLRRSLMGSGIYPPGGRRSAMRECADCGRHAPTSPTDPDVCIDCRANRLEWLDHAEGNDIEADERDVVTELVKERAEDGRARPAEVREARQIVEAIEKQHEAQERRMRDAESEATLLREIASFEAGTWKAETTGDHLYRSFRPSRRR